MKHAPWFALLAFCRALAGPVEEMSDAASRFLAALPAELRARAAFAWSDDERLNWHFIPKDRKGVTLKELSPAQRHLAYGLLGSGLSQRGYLKATTIMSLEQILQDLEGPGRRFPRDPELYHVSIFGTPAARGTWGWRVEGHHLSVNFTLVDGRVAAGTPSFLGTNPAEVRTGPRAGLRTLATEEDLGRQLIQGLPARQQQRAILNAKAPDDVLTAANRKASLARFEGLPVKEMARAHRDLVVKIIEEYVGRVRPEVAEADLARIRRAGLDRIHFAWAGGLERGQGHYYRVHGPTFLLEYDNTQNDANHVHAVWRDFDNDFGLDVLAEHYKASHSK